ncbi:protein split ends [Trichonephila clavipes]|nr:protein split ends [Trichonephila clavipes]
MAENCFSSGVTYTLALRRGDSRDPKSNGHQVRTLLFRVVKFWVENSFSSLVYKMDSYFSKMKLSSSPMNDSSEFCSRYPVVWYGTLKLQNYEATVRMHYVSGNLCVARKILPPVDHYISLDPSTDLHSLQEDFPPRNVRTAKRMRVEPEKFKALKVKMQMDEDCVLIAVPWGRDSLDLLRQLRNFKSISDNSFAHEEAAGAVNAAHPGSDDASCSKNLLPSNEFSDSLQICSEDLKKFICEVPHLKFILSMV